MKLSLAEKIQSKRDRDFQTRLLAALEQKPPKRSRFGSAISAIFKVLNSPLFLTVLGSLIALWVFSYRTYSQCVADTRKEFKEYVSLKSELETRRLEIADKIVHTKSISDLRNSIDEQKSFSIKYKNFTISDLELLYLDHSQAIDERGINKKAYEEFKRSPLYEKFTSILYGHVDEKIRDDDLNDLITFAQYFTAVDIIQFATDLRTISVIECNPLNVFHIMLGETPVTLQRYDAGSFVDAQRARREITSRRNLLPPKAAPAPFPATTFKPPPEPTPASNAPQ